ncbi:hypothetical protein F5148DRAFT_235009 [Russula earlei]|uniref:Uncharacterized protein n=1 Tax=Russula earlei TaxID=71964 RepID=A0ACC0U3X9_9AGAM|nr:hypothetical protein F5148DRAFT_235009 [Russula earlei]
MAEMGVEPPLGFASHEMRITQSGKIHAWVEFALKFFEENEEKALVLHTLPAAARGKSGDIERTEVTAGDGNKAQDEPPRQGTDAVNKDKGGISTASTITIPRLISVVEIIKREYLAAMNAKRTPDLVGLYQYNEMGSLEGAVENEREEDAEERGGDRTTMIMEALAGTENVRTTRTPYMKVTLCRKELVGMKDRGATAQAPLKRQMSKSAKGRLKKRLRKEEERRRMENGNSRVKGE